MQRVPRGAAAGGRQLAPRRSSCSTGPTTSPTENIAEFKKRFNISDANFTYDTYPSNEELFSKLKGGAVGQYDICCPTAEWTPDMVKEGFLEKIDWSKIPNAKYIDPQFKGLWWDPNDEYQLPKDWGTTGISMRTNVVTEDVKTWQRLLRHRAEVLGPDRRRRLAG